MKKAIAFLTGIMCVLGLTACGNVDNDDNSEKSAENASSEASTTESEGTSEEATSDENKKDASAKITVRSCDTISAGNYNTVGLRSDGTVVTVGRNDEGQCDADRWTNIRVPQ